MNFVSSRNLFLRYFIVFIQILEKLGKKSPKFETFTMSSMLERGGSAVTISRVSWWRHCSKDAAHSFSVSTKPKFRHFCVCRSLVCLLVRFQVIWLIGYACVICLQGSCSWLAADGDHNFATGAFFSENPWDMAVHFSREINAGQK